MKSRYNGFFDLKYQTRLSVAECFSRILSEPHVFESTVYSQSMVIYAGEDAALQNLPRKHGAKSHGILHGS